MKFFTQKEVAAILRRTPQTIARWRRAGLLPYVAGKPVLISEQQLHNLIEKWQEPTKAHDWNKTTTAFTKSAGQRTAEASAYRRGQQAFKRLNDSSQAGFKKQTPPKKGR